MRSRWPIPRLLACALLAVAAVLPAADGRPTGGETQVASPNGAVRFKLRRQEGRLTFAVTLKDNSVIEPSFKLPDGAGYASITEAALVNYAGVALQAGGRPAAHRMRPPRCRRRAPPSAAARLRRTSG
jgi:hypothetical protein